MAKQKQQPELDETPESPTPAADEPRPMPYRLLVNPLGNVVAFRPEDKAYEEFLYAQRPPGVAHDRWYREPTAAQVAAYVAAHPY